MKELRDINVKVEIPLFDYELPAQNFFYEFVGLDKDINRSYGTDGFLKSILFEHKLDFGSSYGLGKAKRQFNDYREKLRNNGEYDPQYSCAVEDNGLHRAIIFDNATGDKIDEFIWTDEPDKFRNYINDDVIKYYVNENTVIGIASKYYEENPTANKRNFFDDYITKDNDKFHKFRGSEKDFSLIMDKLNDPTSQKVLGAFYTPDVYVEKSTEYVRNAINQITSCGKDYLIIDRCAGSGNLLRKFTPQELSHCIVSTYEAKEWVALTQNFAGKVKKIIPLKYEPDGVLLKGGDALAKEFLDNFKEEFRLRDEGLLEIILLENPPFRDSRGQGDGTGNKKDADINTKTDYYSKLKAEKRFSQGSIITDTCNQFILSGFEYFKPTHYILYAPVKYWKSNQIIDKTFVEGMICNRKEFGAGETGITLIHWKNEDAVNEQLLLDTLDYGKIKVVKVNENISSLWSRKKTGEQVGWFSCTSFAIDYKNSALIDDPETMRKLKSHKIGIELYTDDLLDNLVLWCANEYVLDNYTERDILMKCGDGRDNYKIDKDFINDCLFYALLSHSNHCSPSSKLYTYGFSIFNQKKKHGTLMKLWNNVFNKTSMYGLYNIIKNPDNYRIIMERGKEKKVWIDGELRDWVENIKFGLQKFYRDYIKPKMLEYQLVR